MKHKLLNSMSARIAQQSERIAQLEKLVEKLDKLILTKWQVAVMVGIVMGFGASLVAATYAILVAFKLIT